MGEGGRWSSLGSGVVEEHGRRSVEEFGRRSVEANGRRSVEVQGRRSVEEYERRGVQGRRSVEVQGKSVESKGRSPEVPETTVEVGGGEGRSSLGERRSTYLQWEEQPCLPSPPATPPEEGQCWRCAG